MPEGQHPTFYSVLSHAPVRAASNGVDLSIYHQASEEIFSPAGESETGRGIGRASRISTNS